MAQVEFKYDTSIFSDGVSLDAHLLTNRFREVAFLHGGATINYRLRSEENGEGDKWKAFQFEGGLKEYVEWLNRDKTAMHPPIYFRATSEDVEVVLPVLYPRR